MNYLINNINYVKESKFNINWQLENHPELLDGFIRNYQIKNNFIFMDFSFFNYLYDLFKRMDHKTLGNFLNEDYLDELSIYRYFTRLIILNRDYKAWYVEELLSDFKNNLDYVLSEIDKIKPLVVKEFKIFLNNYFEVVKKDNSKYKDFIRVYNTINKEVDFLSKSKIANINNARVDITNIIEKYSYSFIPGGTCSHNVITINSDIGHKWPANWNKKMLNNILFHEFGHMIKNIDETKVLKNDAFIYNKIFLIAVKKNYKLLLKFKLSCKSAYAKKSLNFEKYYCEPKLLNGGTKIFNYNRAMAESFAESFAIIYSHMKNKLDYYNYYILHAKNSNQRVSYKVLFNTLIYVLDNVNWELFNFTPAHIRKKRQEIKLYLNKVNEKKIEFNSRNRDIAIYKNKLYFNVRDLIKRG